MAASPARTQVFGPSGKQGSAPCDELLQGQLTLGQSCEDSAECQTGTLLPAQQARVAAAACARCPTAAAVRSICVLDKPCPTCRSAGGCRMPSPSVVPATRAWAVVRARPASAIAAPSLPACLATPVPPEVAPRRSSSAAAVAPARRPICWRMPAIRGPADVCRAAVSALPPCAARPATSAIPAISPSRQRPVMPASARRAAAAAPSAGHSPMPAKLASSHNAARERSVTRTA